MIVKTILYIFSLFLLGYTASAQERMEEFEQEGQLVSALVIDNDTFIISHLDKVSVTSPREFASREEYRLYRRYKRYAAKVYPYASEAIRVIAHVERETEGMKRSKKKKYAKKKKKELTQKFKGELKNLTKTQGRILIKMIEKELDQSMFDILKEMRGGLTAGTWQSTGKLYGYDLKSKYEPGQDELLDVVLQDFNISLHGDKQ